MKTSPLLMAGVAASVLLTVTVCQAEEPGKQSVAAKQAAKARDFSARQEKEGPADVAGASSTAAAGQKDGDKTPVLDSRVVDKAAQDTGDSWKKMDKVLDRF
jgi:hypothetical protein